MARTMRWGEGSRRGGWQVRGGKGEGGWRRGARGGTEADASARWAMTRGAGEERGRRWSAWWPAMGPRGGGDDGVEAAGDGRARWGRRQGREAVDDEQKGAQGG